jgi:hypothetical protein
MSIKELQTVMKQLVINQVAINARQLQIAEGYNQNDYLKPIPSKFIESACDDFTSIIENVNAIKLKELISKL